MLDKKALIESINKEIQAKIHRLESEMNELQFALSDDTKSTSGDKHETSRAMAQQEIQNLGENLQNWLKMNGLASTLMDKKCMDVQLGALVHTQNKTFFISVGLGKIIIDGKEIYCLAPSSPLSQVLLGKTIGETATFGGNKHEVINIY
jgi:transcription elongation GreA/GreB family factor